nr:uncharacterized mitochondrial protein AtMg00810-like [Tanacetum cinerariifolium]
MSSTAELPLLKTLYCYKKIRSTQSQRRPLRGHFVLVLERDVEIRDNKIEYLKNELEQIKKEKESLDNKLTGFENALKDLDNLLGSQRSDKNKEGLGYSAVPPPHAQICSPPKKDLSWTSLLEFVDDIFTGYRRPTPSIDASKYNKSELQSSNFSVFEHGESTGSIMETWPKDNYTHKSMTPRVVLLKSSTTPIVVSRPNMNVAQPKMTSFAKTAHSNVIRSFQRKSAVKNQPRVLRVSTVDSKFPTAKSTLTADLGEKGKGNPQNNIDDKGYWDSGCSRHMTGNIFYLSEYEPYDRGYVSFGHRGGKITGKGIIKTGKLEFENVYFVKELKYNLFSVSQICDNKNSVLFTDSVCLVLGKDFKLNDDTNVLLRTPRHHNMYSIDPNNIVPHKNLTCLVAKASVDERKQHKASCKTKLVNYVSKPLHTLHMDLFGPTSVSSLNHKWYCSVVTDDFSRNKTLIEAARTMLADAKLHVTFWAEAVNTACYVQNRVLVNKSQNKTPYELFNSRIPAIGFLRPFGCRVMILNTLDHLEKFDAKGDEENKLIEKGAGPNWLFNIDTLTNSMNYVPVVVARTSSTNILGTKDVTSQAVKKDVSSLRYIALPNWFHEAHMETSNDTIRNSDAQDGSQKEKDCNDDVPESSGITNPTALQKFHISPESSSGPRLISKGVFSQKEAPSLGNALTLSNRFEDTFGDTTNAATFNEVEADLSNMETSIPMDVKSAFIYGTIDEEMLGQLILPWTKRILGEKMDLVKMWNFIYIYMIRSLMYLTASRPDIIFVVCACARHQLIPKECHLHVVKRIFRYLKGHPKLGLWYPKESPFDLVAYSDSDYGGTTQDRKSTTGGCQFLGRRLISWQCKKQTIVATSTTEAEYVAAASGCGETIVATSTTEAEYVAAASGCGEVKRPGIKLDQGSSKWVKISYTSRSEPSQEQKFKGSKGVSEEDLKGMMQLVHLEEVYIKALQPMRIPIISAKDKGKEKVTETEVSKKKKFQEQIDAQVAREMEEEFARENQRLSKQAARDSKIARIHAEEELKLMIKGLDRSNEV